MNKKIVDYIILRSDDIDELGDDVRYNLQRAYQPYGNLIKSEDNHFYYQVMVKYEWANN